jgi:hypothetical protein
MQTLFVESDLVKMPGSYDQPTVPLRLELQPKSLTQTRPSPLSPSGCDPGILGRAIANSERNLKGLERPTASFPVPLLRHENASWLASRLGMQPRNRQVMGREQSDKACTGSAVLCVQHAVRYSHSPTDRHGAMIHELRQTTQDNSNTRASRVRSSCQVWYLQPSGYPGTSLSSAAEVAF